MKSATGQRGMTLLELTLSLTIIATLTLAVATMFRLGILASKLAAAETTLLSNVRKALHGDGAKAGLILDTLYASSATAVSASTLSLYAPNKVATSYTLSSTNLLRTAGSATATLATGLSDLSFSYYALDSNGLIVSTATAGSAALVTFSFKASLPRGTVTFVSAGRPRNRR